MLVVIYQLFRRTQKYGLGPCKRAPLARYPSVSVIVPCYLPNEHGIIQDTLLHLLNTVQYPGQLTIVCVFNTPTAMKDAEAALYAMEDQYSTRSAQTSRVLRIRNASGRSTSKAENLNLVLNEIDDDVIAVYDADHRPWVRHAARDPSAVDVDPRHPPPARSPLPAHRTCPHRVSPQADALQLLVETLESEAADAVQGSIAIRTRRTMLARLVCAETFAVHFVYMPMLAAICNTGFYGGSNAVWRASVLRE